VDLMQINRKKTKYPTQRGNSAKHIRQKAFHRRKIQIGTKAAEDACFHWQSRKWKLPLWDHFSPKRLAQTNKSAIPNVNEDVDQIEYFQGWHKSVGTFLETLNCKG
jgi:hypothetical protein